MTNIAIQGRQVNTSLMSSLSGCLSPGRACTRSFVVEKVMRFNTMMSPPKIAIVTAQPLAESPPPNLATRGSGSAWMRNWPTSAPTKR